MEIIVNGTPRPSEDGQTIAHLLSELQLDQRQVAVEVNRDLVPREQHAQHILCDGDRLEIVTLVGGG